MLTRNQRIGAAIILFCWAAIWVGLHFVNAPEGDVRTTDSLTQKRLNKKAYYDSLRTARKLYYDSLRLVRRDSLHRVYLAHRDSMRHADSVWWDSVRIADSLWIGQRPIKRDTILDLNTADTTQLQLIRGIGPATARRIVRYRHLLGGFVSPQQLQDDQLYWDQYGHSTKSRYCIADSVLRFFTANTDSVLPIPVNHASVERLQRHPYISFTLAKNIYTLRRQRIRLNSIDDLQQVNGMSDSLLIRLTPYLCFD